MTKNEIIEFWIRSSDNDYKTFEHLNKSRDYTWSLFLGHLVIEKLLKAYYVKNNDINVPFTHDLLRLAEKSAMRLTEQQKDFLDKVTTFNINARYDDYKMKFYKKCTKEFASESIKEIKEYRKWIKKML